MTEPRRWLDDPEAPSELKQLLASAPRGRSLDAPTRARLDGRIRRVAALPIGFAAWLSVKSAAAVGVAAGVATASVVAVVERVEAPPREPAGKAAVEGQRGERPARVAPQVPREAAPAVPEPEPRPADNLAPDPAPAKLPPAPERLPSANPQPELPGNLAEETALLERARRAVASDPRSALELTAEHARRFPRGVLSSERSLIEMEALVRSGERQRARALGERLLARGADDLYAERVRRLLAKLEGGT